MYTATGVLDRDATINQFVPLVKRMAHHLAAKLPPSVSLDDMIQAGLIGLMDAASRFQQDHGTQFETYATQRIRGAMLDELRQNDWLPRGVRSAQRKIETALSKLEQRLGRVATERELAAELNMPLGEYQELLQQARGCQLLYLEDLAEGEGEEQFLDRNCADEDLNPLKQLEDDRFRSSLIAAIEHLPEREKNVMGLYYEQELNFREIAAILNVTESRVCQIHSQAIARLRGKLKAWTETKDRHSN